MTKRLKEFGFTLAMYRRAVVFFQSRGFCLGYGGRGAYRGMFHLSNIDNAIWRSFKCYDPAAILDNPSQIMKQLADILATRPSIRNDLQFGTEVCFGTKKA